MKAKDKQRAISKRMSYVLRHAPDSIELTLDPAGWASVDELISQLGKHRKSVTREEMDFVVENCAKQRFEYSEDGSKIRARQGHSIEVALEYEAVTPPDVLLHGSASRFLEPILAEGLQRKNRHHVHLSTDRKTMLEVGGRHGKAVLIEIDAAKMHEAGHEFFVTGNDVWLTDHVPPEYLKVRDDR